MPPIIRHSRSLIDRPAEKETGFRLKIHFRAIGAGMADEHGVVIRTLAENA